MSNSVEGMRILFIQNMETFYDCLQIDEKLFVNCYVVEIHKAIEISCNSLQYKFEDNIKQRTPFSFIINDNNEIQFEEMEIPCEGLSLKSWIDQMKDPKINYNLYQTSFQALESENPVINITLPQFVGRKGFDGSTVTIETVHRKKLYSGEMKNGSILGNIDPKVVHCAEWRTRLTIGIDNSKEVGMICSESSTKYKSYVKGFLKNGHLHGFVQMYGILSIDPLDPCSGTIEENAISFIGHFQNGKPFGTCWQQLFGGSWIYGYVNDLGEFTGLKDIAYIYSDLELALKGEFSKGILVNMISYKNSQNAYLYLYSTRRRVRANMHQRCFGYL